MKTRITLWSWTPLLRTYPKELKAGIPTDICTSMFIAALFTIAKKTVHQSGFSREPQEIRIYGGREGERERRGEGRGEEGRGGEGRGERCWFYKLAHMTVEAGKSRIFRVSQLVETQEELVPQFKSADRIPPSLREISLFLLWPSNNWMMPTHITESNLLYSKSSNVNVNLI